MQGGQQLSDQTVQDLKERLLAAALKSFHRHSQETRVKDLPYHVSVVRELIPVDREGSELFVRVSAANDATLYHSGSRVIY
jgi:hypothetical protein